MVLESLFALAGVRAVAEVEIPRGVDFCIDFPTGALKRLLVLEGVQDPGNVVRYPSDMC